MNEAFKKYCQEREISCKRAWRSVETEIIEQGHILFGLTLTSGRRGPVKKGSSKSDGKREHGVVGLRVRGPSDNYMSDGLKDKKFTMDPFRIAPPWIDVEPIKSFSKEGSYEEGAIQNSDVAGNQESPDVVEMGEMDSTDVQMSLDFG